MRDACDTLQALTALTSLPLMHAASVRAGCEDDEAVVAWLVRRHKVTCSCFLSPTTCCAQVAAGQLDLVVVLEFAGAGILMLYARASKHNPSRRIPTIPYYADSAAGVHHSWVQLRGAGPRAGGVCKFAAGAHEASSCSAEGRAAGARAAGPVSADGRVAGRPCTLGQQPAC